MSDANVVQLDDKNDICASLGALLVVVMSQVTKDCTIVDFVLTWTRDNKRWFVSRRSSLLEVVVVLMVVRNGDDVGIKLGKLEADLLGIVGIGNYLDRAVTNAETGMAVPEDIHG
jgi:hypothetical protein